MRPSRVAVPILACLLIGPAASAEDRVDYLRQVKPLLAARCYACHGALQTKGGLRADTARSLLDGGEDGPAVVPGAGDESPLIGRVSGGGGGRMPPPSEGEGLTAAEIALLKAWIGQGAPAPTDERPEPDPRDHWAFRPPARVPVPPAPGFLTGGGNPIDAFLAAGWEGRGLKPRPPADRRLVLRRVYLDLIGLPPSGEELAAFEADAAPDAYERVVDRLLASPRYGERWGRHWMDIWRYSDWWGLGAEVRNSQKHIWHWRDWIIEALNADEGYDGMLRAMLAADELFPDDPGRLRATGFLARPYFKFNRNTWLEDAVEHTGKAFLGLTLNCAKCHDHKYDPISQADYYRFRAFFEPYQVRTDLVLGQPDPERDGIPRAFDCNLDAPTYRFERGDESRPLKDRPLKPGLPPVLALGGPKIEPVRLPAEAAMPGLRAFVIDDLLHAADARIDAARVALDQARSADAAEQPPTERARSRIKASARVLALAEAQPGAIRARAEADRARAGPAPAPAAVAAGLATRALRLERMIALAKAEDDLARAALAVSEADAAKQEAALKALDAAKGTADAARKAIDAPGGDYTPIAGARKTPESNVETEASRNRPFPATSTGRRAALAGWLTDRRHPLTARVAVNHIWLRHFGTPLVPSVFDFGRKGAPPTHPELLDWLAAEFMDHGWSMKHLHRLIVTSAAYRRASSAAGADPATLAADPENRGYWRMNPVRMEAQVVRDSLLHLAGALDSAMGGPPTPPADEASRRRSLYFVHSHNDHHKFLATFDDASVLECYRRSGSIVPAQALALSNSRLALEMAAKIADRLDGRPGSAADEAFARAAFGTILAGAPNPAELAACVRALADLNALLTAKGVADPGRRARADLVQALLNHNDFLTIR